MELHYAKRRSNDYVDGDKSYPTFDLPHVWPNNQVLNGVVHTSWVGVRNLTLEEIEIGVWMAGVPAGERHSIKHGFIWSAPSQHFAPFSVVIFKLSDLKNEDLLSDIHIFWELTPGKA